MADAPAANKSSASFGVFAKNPWPNYLDEVGSRLWTHKELDIGWSLMEVPDPEAIDKVMYFLSALTATGRPQLLRHVAKSTYEGLEMLMSLCNARQELLRSGSPDGKK